LDLIVVLEELIAPAKDIRAARSPEQGNPSTSSDP
jgi:hypothetical protein